MTRFTARRSSRLIALGLGLAGALFQAPVHAQQMGDVPMTMNLCQVPLTPAEATNVFRAINSDTTLEKKLGSGIILRTKMDVRTKPEVIDGTLPLRVEGILSTQFEFAKEGTFGVIKTAGDIAQGSMPVEIDYDPATQMLTAMLQGTTEDFGFFAEVSDVVFKDTTVTKGGDSNLDFESTDEKTKVGFGMKVSESRSVNTRKLKAQAFGLPARLSPVIQCDARAKSIMLGTRLATNFDFKLMAQKIEDLTRMTSETVERDISGLLDNQNISAGDKTMSSSRDVVSREAFEGDIEVSAKGEGLLASIVLDPGLISDAVPAKLPFRLEAKLEFRFDINKTPVTGVRRAQETLDLACSSGPSC